MIDDDNNKLEKGLALAAGIAEEHLQKELAQYDEFYNLIFLLDKVNRYTPRDKWIIPILKSPECSDFKTQLLTAIEDYEEAEND